MLSEVRKNIRAVAGLNQQQLSWLIPLFLLSGLLRFAVLLLPFRWLAPILGEYNGNTKLSVLATKEQELLARQVGWLIRAVCCRTPWQSKCLIRAMLAEIVLRYYRIPCVVFLGLNHGDVSGRELEAHAWVTAGRVYVSGGNGHATFIVVSTWLSNI